MKKIHIELTDKQHCLLTRIAKAEKRKLADLIYMAISSGLGSIFCERGVYVPKTKDEYTSEENKQLAKNEKLEKTKGWKALKWKEREARGFDHVDSHLCNYGDEKDFVSELSDSIEANIYNNN